MDRIDMQAANGIAARLRARSASPVAQPERVRPTANEADQAGAAALAAVALAKGDAPVDHERVAAIRQALDSGTYSLDPRKTADAMIAAGFLPRSTK